MRLRSPTLPVHSVTYVEYYAVGKYTVTTHSLSGCDCFVALGLPISIAALSISAPMISNNFQQG